MGKMMDTGGEMPPKVLQMYRAVMELIEEGEDIADLKVSTITDKAGIGKGTAYEYFETKDEIVVSAIVYYMQFFFGKLHEELMRREIFRERLAYLLDEVEKVRGRKVCFFRFLHFLSNTSEFSVLIRNKLREEGFEPYLPMHFLSEMVKQARENNEIASEAPVDYLVCFLMAQLMNYTLTVSIGADILGTDSKGMRRNIEQSIQNELQILCVKNKKIG